MKKIPLIIDCDPGIDDALALLLLYKHREKFDIKLISATAGNCPLSVTINNVAYFRDRYFKGVPIAMGLEKPLVKVNPSNAEDVHGPSGLGIIDVGKQDLSKALDALTTMRDILMNSKEKITLLTLGAQTNIARLIIAYPEVRDKIEVIYAMIGSINGEGNIEPYAEFNAYFDPEAFDIVAKSGIPMIINPLELAKGSKISRTLLSTLRPTNSNQQFAYDLITNINEFNDPYNVGIYDAHSAMALINPTLYNFVPCDIETFTNSGVRGKCLLTENKNGKYKYQVIKDTNKCNKYMLDELLSLE